MSRLSPSPCDDVQLPSCAVNFRDFGRLESRHGGWIRPHRLYRSGHMAALDAEDVRRLQALDFHLIADLRYAEEQAQQPSPWPATFADRVLSHDEARNGVAPHMMLLQQPGCDADEVRQHYRQLYGELPFDPAYRALFANVVRRMADVDGRVLVHCSAGKDMTGVLVALILELLGAAPEAVMADYLRTAADPQLMTLGAPVLRPLLAEQDPERADELISALLGVEETYLDSALRAIERQCGSVEFYLEEAGVTADVRQRLQARYIAR